MLIRSNSLDQSIFFYIIVLTSFGNMSNKEAERDEIKDETHELQDDESDMAEETDAEQTGADDLEDLDFDEIEEEEEETDAEDNSDNET